MEMAQRDDAALMRRFSLPTPHDAMRGSFAWFCWGCEVEYIGTSVEALRAAGCIRRDACDLLEFAVPGVT
jgi:hypothetical protein